MYAKINGVNLISYPYGWSDFVADNPYTNYQQNTDFVSMFPNTDFGQQGYSLVEVTQVSQPTTSREQILEEGTPVLANGVWVQVWNVTQKSDEEIAAMTADAAAGVRKQRNIKLTACDWTQIADSTADKAAWAAYRQALRDLTKQSGFPWDIVWPTQP